jgi:DNA-binding NtrC family response regulator
MTTDAGTKKILVVDDEAVVCESCRRILIREGYLVDTCSDSRTGLRLAELTPYDLVLLDLRMPIVDGVRFLERLREVHPEVPVVIITGHMAEASSRAAERLGKCEYVAKPFTPEEITAAVQRSLSMAGGA